MEFESVSLHLNQRLDNQPLLFVWSQFPGRKHCCFQLCFLQSVAKQHDVFPLKIQTRAILPLKFTEFVHTLSCRKRKTFVGQLFRNLKYLEHVKKRETIIFQLFKPQSTRPSFCEVSTDPVFLKPRKLPTFSSQLVLSICFLSSSCPSTTLKIEIILKALQFHFETFRWSYRCCLMQKDHFHSHGSCQYRYLNYLLFLLGHLCPRLGDDRHDFPLGKEQLVQQRHMTTRKK